MQTVRRELAAAFFLTLLCAGRVAYAAEQPLSKPLGLRDFARMRRDRVPTKTIVQKASEQGVDFKVTPGVEKQLARLGFNDDEIAALRQAFAEPEKPNAGRTDDGPPAAPGEDLPSSDEDRETVYRRIAKIARLSGVVLQPTPTRHVTVWIGDEDQDRFVSDLKRIDNFLERKCAKPLRSGLDKRTAHLVVLKSRYDYQKWVNAMYEVMPESFKLTGAPNGKEDLKASVLKWSGFYSRNAAVICREGRDEQSVRRSAAADIAYMTFAQQVEPGRQEPLATGFANSVEALLFGQPSVLLFSNSYHNENRNLGSDPRAWLHLVQDRIRRKNVTAVRALLAMDTTNMLLPHYAEAWTLNGLLAKQPEKFGELTLLLREEKDALKAIEQVYGWNEKKLDEEWHKSVLAER